MNHGEIAKQLLGWATDDVRTTEERRTAFAELIKRAKAAKLKLVLIPEDWEEMPVEDFDPTPQAGPPIPPAPSGFDGQAFRDFLHVGAAFVDLVDRVAARPESEPAPRAPYGPPRRRKR